MTPAEILDGAIDVIHERGWCRRVLHDKEGRVCLRGAVYAVVDDETGFLVRPEFIRSYHAALSGISNVLFERYGHREISVVNDAHLSDADEAIEVLKLARERVS